MFGFPSVLFNRKPEDPAVIVPAETLAERVIAAAKSIVGQREKPGNSGFVNADFEEEMKRVGFSKGQAWCAYTTELIWKEGFTKQHPLYPELDKLFSASAVKTFENFRKSPLFKTGKEPRPGALILWRHGKGWQGHAGVVIDVLSNGKFGTVEGNTNADGGREGIEVALKVRRTGEAFKANGLNIEGFVYLPE